MTQLEVARSAAPALAALIAKHKTGTAIPARGGRTRPAPVVGGRGNHEGDAA